MFFHWHPPSKKSTFLQSNIPSQIRFSQCGHLGGSLVERLPLAQGVVLGSRDQVPHWAPCMEPASPSACVSAPAPMNK